MKMRKSTIVLIVVILVTVVIGAAAVYTAVLLQKEEKVTEEEAEAAPLEEEEEEEAVTPTGYTSWCSDDSGSSIISFKQDQFAVSGGKATLKFSVSNDSAGALNVVLRPMIFHCMHTCDYAAGDARCNCSEDILKGAADADLITETLAAGATKQYTVTADTGLGEDCGRWQYDLVVVDVKQGGTRVEACNKPWWVLTKISDSGDDCSVGCEITAEGSTSDLEAGDSVDLTTTISPAGASLTSHDWAQAPSGSGTYGTEEASANTYTNTYTVGDTEESSIDLSFTGASQIVPEGVNPKYGVGYNSLKAAATTIYLPGVGNFVADAERTDIYIFNPGTSTSTGTLTFYDATTGTVSKTETVSVEAKSTTLKSTEDLFSVDFAGNATLSMSSGVIVNYEKIDGDGGERSWGFEGVPSDMARTQITEAPVMNHTMQWGIDYDYISIYNPNDAVATMTYELCLWTNGENCDYGESDVSIPAHGSYTFNVSETIPATPPDGLCGNGTNSCWWTGQVNVTSDQPVVLVHEDYGIQDPGGADSNAVGNYGRGTVSLYNSASQVCVMPVIHELYGTEKTGMGIGNTSEAGLITTATALHYYDNFTGKETISEYSLPEFTGKKTYHRDTGWITGDTNPYTPLPENSQGVVVFSSGAVEQLVGRMQSIADPSVWGNNAYGHGTSAIPCAASDLSNTVYLSGLLNTANGTRATSIQVFNPSATATVEGTITLYGNDGETDGTYKLYLKPHAMQEIVVGWLVPEQWYGSAVISGNGGIVATAVTISDDTLETSNVLCDITLTLGEEPVPGELDCTLVLDPDEVDPGDTTTGTVTITDTAGESGDEYDIGWDDSASVVTFENDTQSTEYPDLEVENDCTVSSSTTQTSATVTATVTKGTEEATCSDVLTITQEDEPTPPEPTPEPTPEPDTQPSTGIGSPILVLAGSGGLFTGAGYLAARNSKRLGQLISKVMPGKYERGVVSSVSKKRRKI